jgi:hypothetical protein
MRDAAAEALNVGGNSGATLRDEGLDRWHAAIGTESTSISLNVAA